MRRLRKLVLALLVWFVVVSPTRVEAAPTDRGFLFVVFSDDPEARRTAVARALAAHFTPSEAALDVVTEPRAATLREQADFVAATIAREGRRGGFWIDLASASEAQLFFVEPGAQRVLVRRIAWQDEATMAEDVALVARATADALNEGATIGMAPAPGLEPGDASVRAPVLLRPASPAPFVETRETRIASERPPTAAALPSPAASQQRWEVHAAFDATTISSALPFFGGLAIGGAYAVTDPLWVGAELSVHPGATLETSRGDRLSIRKVRLEAGAALRRRADWLALGVWAGLFGEILTRTTLQLTDGARATPSGDAAVIGGSLRGEVGVGTSEIVAFLRAGPDFAFNPPRFAVQAAGKAPAEIAATAVVRFHGMAGAGLRFR